MLWNYLPLVGFGIFTVGIVLQVKKTLSRGRVRDIHLGEVGARTLGSALTMVGMVHTGNRYLILGNGIMLLAMVTYLTITVHTKRRSQQ